ncbi:hypothetical protein PH586_00020 [Pseudomonas sp. SA3-5]|uniref:Type I restriction endonuclease subunit M n=1 Tax=Pseudomonas aestuarii TaxID=3018340 RepID=A0ABT4X907_9PSED|nr:hypothetical protein [Pseudomonas aestuarii]MDA7084771.1 hypothetical protein [Pseudomonas aestuarii]
MDTKESSLFRLGNVVITPTLLRVFTAEMTDPTDFLARHQSGDFGDLCANDIDANQYAIHHETRILSCYHLGKTKFWIITEADRSSTTMLLPDEY